MLNSKTAITKESAKAIFEENKHLLEDLFVKKGCGDFKESVFQNKIDSDVYGSVLKTLMKVTKINITSPKTEVKFSTKPPMKST